MVVRMPLAFDQWYKLLFERTGDAILVVEVEGGSIVDANGAAQRMWGYTLQEFQGIHYLDLHPPFLREVYSLMFDAHVHVSAPQALMPRCRILCKSGEEKIVELRTTTFELGGRVYAMGFFRDIAREEQVIQEAERLRHVELAQSRTMFEAVFDAFPEAVMVIDPQVPRFVMVNRAAVERYGYGREEWDTLHPQRICPQWVGGWWRVIAESCGEQNQVFREALHKKKGGGEFPVEVYASRVELSAHLHLLMVAVDVTYRHDLVERLRSSEELYRETVSTIPDYLYKVNREGGRLVPQLYTLVTQQISGYPAQAYLDDPWLWFKIIHPQDKPRIKVLMERLLSGESVAGEFRIICKDGQVKWVLDRAVPTLGQDGEVENIIGVVSDITRAKEAEEGLRRLTQDLEKKVKERTRALQESEALYRNLVENALVGICQMDVEGRILYANDALLSLLQHSKEEVVGCSFKEFLSCREQRVVLRHVLGGLRGGKGCSRTYEIQLIDGRGREVGLLVATSILRNSEGGFGGTVTLVVDISARRALERMLQEKIQELEIFSYSVSHDLKAPLRALEFFSHLLMEECEESLDHKARDYLRRIRKASTQMAMLIDDLLQYSRVGRGGLRFQWIGMDSVVGEALDYLWEGVTGREASVEVQTPLPKVWGDMSTLTLLFINLLSNALKFSKPHKPPWVKVAWLEEEKYYHFMVSDRGIGMEPQHRERIFQVFQRLHTEEDFPGTGMGLAICKKVVDLHRGVIWVEPSPGEGSTFHFTLPKVDGQGKDEN